MSRAVASVALLLVVPALPAASQETPRYEGTAEVVAVDAVVDLTGGPGAGFAHWMPGGRDSRPPDSLAATVDGAPAPVVAVDGPGGELDRIVLYFDLSLSDDHQLTWSADRLGDRVRELVRLGPVELVAAAPVAITTLPPTRDPATLEEALGRLAHLAEPSDELVELRLSGPEGTWDRPSPRERELVREWAEAYLELARALRDQGELERAAMHAEDAAFHFYGDPRTADREVEALLLAAGLHQRLGHRQRARAMLRRAARIDSDALGDHPVLAALPRAPEETLSALAGPGGGEAAGWVRIGTPRAVSEARARQPR